MPDRESKKAEANPEDAKLARIFAQTAWRESWKAANPDADSDATKAAWKDARKEQVKAARQFIRKLKARGVTLGLAANAEADDD